MFCLHFYATCVHELTFADVFRRMIMVRCFKFQTFSCGICQIMSSFWDLTKQCHKRVASVYHLQNALGTGDKIRSIRTSLEKNILVDLPCFGTLSDGRQTVLESGVRL